MSLAEFLLHGGIKNLSLGESRHRVSNLNLKPWVQVPICALAKFRLLVLSVSVLSGTQDYIALGTHLPSRGTPRNAICLHTLPLQRVGKIP